MYNWHQIFYSAIFLPFFYSSIVGYGTLWSLEGWVLLLTSSSYVFLLRLYYCCVRCLLSSTPRIFIYIIDLHNSIVPTFWKQFWKELLKFLWSKYSIVKKMIWCLRCWIMFNFTLSNIYTVKWVKDHSIQCLLGTSCYLFLLIIIFSQSYQMKKVKHVETFLLLMSILSFVLVSSTTTSCKKRLFNIFF